MLIELQKFHVLVDVEVKPLPVTLDGEFLERKDPRPRSDIIKFLSSILQHPIEHLLNIIA
jgi:hypothetical protein